MGRIVITVSFIDFIFSLSEKASARANIEQEGPVKAINYTQAGVGTH
jgi:hypothetical protein